MLSYVSSSHQGSKRSLCLQGACRHAWCQQIPHRACTPGTSPELANPCQAQHAAQRSAAQHRCIAPSAIRALPLHHLCPHLTWSVSTSQTEASPPLKFALPALNPAPRGCSHALHSVTANLTLGICCMSVPVLSRCIPHDLQACLRRYHALSPPNRIMRNCSAPNGISGMCACAFRGPHQVVAKFKSLHSRIEFWTA